MDFTFFERHPWATGAIVLGGGLMLYLYWKGGSTTTAVATSGPASNPAMDMANLQANTSLQLAGIQRGAQADTLAAQLQGLQIQGALALQQAQLQATVQGRGIDASQSVALAGVGADNNRTQASVDVAGIAYGNQTAQIGMAYDAQVKMAMAALDAAKSQNELTAHVLDNQANVTNNANILNAQTQQFIAKTNSDTAIQQTMFTTNAQIVLNADSLKAQTTVAGMQADSFNRQTQAQVDIATQNAALQKAWQDQQAAIVAQQMLLQSHLADVNANTAIQLATINGGTQVATAQINATTQQTISNNQTSVANNQIGANVQISKNITDASKSNSFWHAIANVAGVAAMVLL